MNDQKTNQLKLEYLYSYKRSLELWPENTLSYYVNTTHGKTFILECGEKSNPPLVLLHGAKMSSTMWFPNVASWSKNYRVICIDILGDNNRSIMNRNFSDRASYAYWLLEILNEMQLKKINLIGLSYGALHTVNFISLAPDRVEKAVIMSPAATYIPFDNIFYTYAFDLVRSEEGVNRFFSWIFKDRYSVPTLIRSQMEAAMRLNESKTTSPNKEGFPYIFTDKELARIQTPILLMLGECEVMYDSKKAYSRALHSSPNITVEMVTGVGHIMSMENPEFINKRVLLYLDN
ncbi:alpha/beta hydrolase [Cytobacillus praedii]|uniref:alpha/beta fold hydrolase n=1 Tax=Cytobacillus praedii TaxID=1742358 RepID=UPI002E1AE87E|nr:alpha/beta hydrolase [Cytobacillus praedii]